MKILKVTEEEIIFRNGNTISFDHEQDCCEYNYADFKQLEPEAFEYDFDEDLKFEACNYGFRFGDNGRMFYIPCYSLQNGYYTDEVDIYYKNNRVINVFANVIID